MNTSQEAISVSVPTGTEMQKITLWALCPPPLPPPGRGGCFGWVRSAQHQGPLPQVARLQCTFGNGQSHTVCPLGRTRFQRLPSQEAGQWPKLSHWPLSQAFEPWGKQDTQACRCLLELTRPGSQEPNYLEPFKAHMSCPFLLSQFSTKFS